MIEQFSFAVLLAGGLIFIIFGFVEYVIHIEDKHCEHECCATFDSYHEKMCIDCGHRISTKPIETKKREAV